MIDGVVLIESGAHAYCNGGPASRTSASLSPVDAARTPLTFSRCSERRDWLRATGGVN